MPRCRPCRDRWPRARSSSAWCCARWLRAVSRRRSPLPSSIRRCSGRCSASGDMIELANPIAADMAVMRRSLWPGLLRAARENLRRQQPRVRLFEIASRFLPPSDGAPPTGGAYREQKMLAALVLGPRSARAVGAARHERGFLRSEGRPGGAPGPGRERRASSASSRAARRACTRAAAPGLCASGVEIGQIGELHPGVVRELDLTYAPILFEVDYAAAFVAKVGAVSRDFALIR